MRGVSQRAPRHAARGLLGAVCFRGRAWGDPETSPQCRPPRGRSCSCSLSSLFQFRGRGPEGLVIATEAWVKSCEGRVGGGDNPRGMSVDVGGASHAQPTPGPSGGAGRMGWDHCRFWALRRVDCRRRGESEKSVCGRACKSLRNNLG